VDHDRAERLISERVDGERLEPRDARRLEEHLAACDDCRAFERAAYRLRESARFEVAAAVPDLVEPIMSAVEEEVGRRRSRIRLVGPDEVRPRRRLLPRLAPAIAAAVVGVLVGSVLVGGPWTDEPPQGGTALAADDVIREVAAAATELKSYEALFAITEYHFADDVPQRDLTMRVWFRAPERFRMDVVDGTVYPAPTTPTDLELIVNGDAWYSESPTACAKATCPPRESSVRNRVPFAPETQAPTDLVLPLKTLASAEAVTVLGTTTVLDRPAIGIELPFERATWLFPFLSIGGDWRPFYRNDRVRIWLDERDWFPLRWEVYPAGGHERDAWAQRFGLPEEPSRHPIFRVEALSVSRSRPALDVFRVPDTENADDQRATTVRPEHVASEAGFEPVAPDDAAGLELYRVVLPDPDERGRTLLTYAEGLSFLQVGETRSWTGVAPFGPVGSRAEEVALAGGGVAYYEPATTEHGRRLSIHGAGTDLYLESNLSRDRLLEVAASLPVTGLSMPDAWRVRETGDAVVERVTLAEATAAAPFPVALPTELPPGLGLASVELLIVGDEVGVTIYLRDADVDLGDGAIRLHLALADALPPTAAAEPATVEVAGVEGRWTAERGLLEWVADGVYHSLDADALPLEVLLAVAASIPAEAGAPDSPSVPAFQTPLVKGPTGSTAEPR
jgi:outer membrane lipoprotein-sorting protein